MAMLAGSSLSGPILRRTSTPKAGKYMAPAHTCLPAAKWSNYKTVSLKIDDSIFEETEKIVRRVKKSRNSYIIAAIEYYNKHHNQLMKRQKPQINPVITGKKSLALLTELEKDDYVDWSA